MITVAGASYHASYNHCVAKYMAQAGVSVDFVPLEDKGLRGNGNMMMLEQNNLEIAALLDGWVMEQVK